MTREEKLLTLLQPPDYTSKIKLYCQDIKLEIRREIRTEKQERTKRIEIKEWKQ